MSEPGLPMEAVRRLSNADRIAFSRASRLINYPPRDRMPCLLLYGATGMGKSMIIRKLVQDNPGTFDRGTGATAMPVVAFQMPPSPEENNFYDELLRALG